MNYQEIQQYCEQQCKERTTEEQLKELHTELLGRKGTVTQALKNIAELPAQERPQAGQDLNKLRQALEKKIQKHQIILEHKTLEEKLKQEYKDLTIPVSGPELDGHIHPLIQTQRRIEEIFTSMGFQIFDGPELESEYYNFDAVNTPSTHPARDMQDTFWLEGGNLMRTQTTSVQIRAMQQHGAPLRGIVPGRVFRNEKTDDTHGNVFYQVEGIVVDKNITIANLIATMKTMLEEVLEQSIEVRLRPGFFPFVEPGFELDAKVTFQTPGGPKEKWIELVPCGMIHPNVLKEGGIDPEEYSGFAFGLGLDRLAMIQFQIHNLRLFYKNDMEFLKQF